MFLLLYVQRKWILLFIVLFVVFLTLFSIFTWERENLTFPETLIMEGIAPLQRGMDSILRWGGSLLTDFYRMSDLRDENRRLRQELNRLEARLARYNELEHENERLRELFGFEPRVSLDYIGGRIIGYDPNSWLRTVTINRGAQDGVYRDMAVVTGSGLVGRVLHTSSTVSEVLLLNSPQSAVGALVQRTRDLGIVEGITTNRDYLKMKNLQWDASVREGDMIITSGLGELFPKGLAIGTVVRVEQDDLGLAQKAWIRPAVDFNRLEEVLLIGEFEEN